MTAALLPMDAGQFYATHILKNLPAGAPRIDLKRTRYKKFTTFLREINAEEANGDGGGVEVDGGGDRKDASSAWLVKVATSKRGVDSITEVG